MKKRILIVGGTSGIGFELALLYKAEGHTVCITGSKDPSIEGVRFLKLTISEDENQLISDVDGVIDGFGEVNTLIYAAGFLQRGHIDMLSDSALRKMTNVGILAPMLFVKRLKNILKTPLKIMLITSSSQYTPRELEPAYCSVKSGLGMLGASLVRDLNIGKVLVVAPSGVNSKFWAGTSEDTSSMLPPKWVAEQIVELSSGVFKYKYARLLRNPRSVEIIDILDNDLEPVLL